MAEIQLDNALFTNSKEISMNTKYSQIVNYTPQKSSVDFNKRLSDFSVGDSYTGESSHYSLVKRLGFSAIQLYVWNSPETNLIPYTAEYRITDSIFLDGLRYLFVVSRDRKQMRIFKQINHPESPVCGNINNDDITLGDFVNITKYSYYDNGLEVVVDFFPFDKCIHDKFVNISWAKGPSKYSSDTGYIRNELIGIDLVTRFIDQSGSVSEIKQGDYILIHRGDFSSQLALVSLIDDGQAVLNSTVTGFNNVAIPTRTIKTDTAGGSVSDVIDLVGDATSENSNLHSYKVFEDYGEIISFATSDGLFRLHNSGTKPSESDFTAEGNTYYSTTNNLNTPRFLISGYTALASQPFFYDIRRGNLWGGLGGFQAYYFRSTNYQQHVGFSKIESFSGFILLLGYDKIGFVNPETSTPDIDLRLYKSIEENIGFFSPNSYTIQSGVLYYITRERDIKQCVLQIYGEKAVIPKIEIIETMYSYDIDMVKPVINDIIINMIGSDLYICITDYVNTKVIIRNTDYLLRHKRMISGVVLMGYKYNVWFGGQLYDHAGYSDLGQDYKTHIQYQYGYSDYAIAKNIQYIKMVLGSQSVITNNDTKYTIEADIGGWKMERSYDDLRRTDYVRNVMSTYKSGNTAGVVASYPIGFEIYSGNGYGVYRTNKIDMSSEFSKWNNYSLAESFDSDPETNFTLSRFGDIKVPAGITSNIFTFSLTTFKQDKIEIMGIINQYEILDAQISRLENVATITDTSLSRGEPLTGNSGLS